MNQNLRKVIVTLILCLILTLAGLTTLEVAGVITPRVFAILCLAAIIILAVLTSRVFRTALLHSTKVEMRSGPSRRKRLYVLSAALVWLVIAFWLTRGQPWLPRLMGAAVVIAFAAPFAMTKRERSNLSEEPPKRT
jgi:hypothetical protein